MTNSIPPQILTMSLSELRERTELAERLAFASRMTPGSTYSANSSAVNSNVSATADESSASTDASTAQAETTTRRRRTKAEIDAEKKAAEEAEKKAAAQSDPVTTDITADELDDALSLDAADEGDMLAEDDFDLGSGEKEITKDELLKLAAECQAKWKANNDKETVDKARKLLQKYDVQRIADVPEDKVSAFHGEFVKL